MECRNPIRNWENAENRIVERSVFGMFGFRQLRLNEQGAQTERSISTVEA